MSEKPISPLRQRMLEDMSLRGFTPDTQRDYIRAVKKLAAFLDRSPDTATAEDLRAFQLHLTAAGVQPPTINATVTMPRFFAVRCFQLLINQPDADDQRADMVARRLDHPGCDRQRLLFQDAQTSGAGQRRRRCALTNRSMVVSRSRAAFAGVGAWFHKSRNQSAARSSASSSICG